MNKEQLDITGLSAKEEGEVFKQESFLTFVNAAKDAQDLTG